MSSTSTSPPNRRQAQRAATREVVVDAADRLFRRDGYVATTIGAIARESGAAVQTVYNAVGDKGAVLSAVLDRSASGAQGRPVHEFLGERLDAAVDTASLVAALADWFAEVNPRTLPVNRIIDQGAAVDRQIAELRVRRGQQRMERYRRVHALLLERGGLRPGLDADAVGAVVWSVGSPATYEALVVHAGWSLSRYRDWVGRTLAAALLT